MAYEPSDKIGGLSDAELAVFLDEPWNGPIATVTRDGWPYVAPADDLHAHHTRVQVQANARILEGPIAPTASPRLLGADPPPLAPLPGARWAPLCGAHDPRYR